MTCKGVRYSDTALKRVALAEIAGNKWRQSTKRTSHQGCKQCNVAFCKEGSCFAEYYQVLSFMESPPFYTEILLFNWLAK